MSSQTEQAKGEFEKNLKFQQGNITVPGEQELTDQLTNIWLDYRQDLEHFYQTFNVGKPSPEAYRQALLPNRKKCGKAAQNIIELNLQNMVSTDGQLHKKAAQTRNAMFFLLFIGMAGGLGFMSW